MYLLAASCDEKQYWQTIYPIIDTVEDPRMINKILMPIPFSPGFMCANETKPYIKMLRELREKYKSKQDTVGIINYILSGDAAKNKRKMIQNPEAFNIDPNQLKFFTKSWGIN